MNIPINEFQQKKIKQYVDAFNFKKQELDALEKIAVAFVSGVSGVDEKDIKYFNIENDTLIISTSDEQKEE